MTLQTKYNWQWNPDTSNTLSELPIIHRLSNAQRDLADAFSKQDPEYKNGILKIPVNIHTTSLPTTITSDPDGTQTPGHYMETNFKSPTFTSLYNEANNKYHKMVNRNSSDLERLVLRLTIRNTILESNFPRDTISNETYVQKHGSLNKDMSTSTSLENYFSAWASVCIQRASLTSYFLSKCGITQTLEIQSLDTPNGKEQHAYIRLPNKTYFCPTNPQRLPDGSTMINISWTAQWLLNKTTSPWSEEVYTLLAN